MYIFNIHLILLGLHPHKMDLIMVAKVRPTKVPNPSTKKDGRKEVCNIEIYVFVFLDPIGSLAPMSYIVNKLTLS